MKWLDLREEEFEGAIKESGGVCILPIGCVEKHGQHLPVGTDVMTAEAIALAAAEIEPVCIFPTFCFGDAQGIRQHRGSVILSVELQHAMLEALCDEIARNGFKKIMILNAHGGNPSMLDDLINIMIHKKRDYAVVYRNSYDYSLDMLLRDAEAGEEFPELTPEDFALIRDFVEGNKIGGHADIEETAVMLEVAPDLVRPDRYTAEDSSPTHLTDEYAKWGLTRATRFWYLEYPNHYAGAAPEGVSARIGHALVRKRVDLQVGAVRLMKKDDRLLEWNKEWYSKWIE